MYENDSLVTDIRPKGLNVMELHLWICYFTKSYHFDRIKDPSLEYRKYIVEKLSTVWKPENASDFQIILENEINDIQKLGFIDQRNELTEKGITFVTLALNGSYRPSIIKFENLMSIYMMILSMPSAMTLSMPLLDDNHKHEDEVTDEDFVTLDIPKKAFLEMMEKYTKKSNWETFKSIFK